MGNLLKIGESSLKSGNILNSGYILKCGKLFKKWRELSKYCGKLSKEMGELSK